MAKLFDQNSAGFDTRSDAWGYCDSTLITANKTGGGQVMVYYVSGSTTVKRGFIPTSKIGTDPTMANPVAVHIFHGYPFST